MEDFPWLKSWDLSETTQKGCEMDAIIPVIQLGKPGLKEELTGLKQGSLEVAKSGFERKVVCC